MNTKRSHFAIVVNEGRIYAIGGKLGNRRSNTVQYYDPIEDEWYSVHAMNTPREFPSAVMFKKHLYVIGGSIESNVGTASVERYDGKWKMVNRNRIYQSFQRSSFHFSIFPGSIKQMSSLNVARDLIACCVFKNRLIAVGGYNSNSEPVSVAEIYDETEDKWQRLQTMNKARGGSLLFVTSSCFEFNT